MNKEKEIDTLLNDAQAIFNNIEWNLGALIGISSIVLNPKLIYFPIAPLRIDADGLDVDGLQCLGVGLLEKDRVPRANEILAMAKRSLICEALELSADFLVRASRIVSQGKDPYEEDQYFSVDIRELWNANSGKAGEFINTRERDFLEGLVAPLRNFIRHNNGKLPPKKSIEYYGQPSGISLNINFLWKEGEDNNIKLPLKTAHDIFTAIRKIVEDGLLRAKIKIKGFLAVSCG